MIPRSDTLGSVAIFLVLEIAGVRFKRSNLKVGSVWFKEGRGGIACV
jgi:hypothetical protein